MKNIKVNSLIESLIFDKEEIFSNKNWYRND